MVPEMEEIAYFFLGDPFVEVLSCAYFIGSLDAVVKKEVLSCGYFIGSIDAMVKKF